MNSKFSGSIVGLAVGDALGYPCEFRTRAGILNSFPPHGVTDFEALHDPRWPERPYIVGSGDQPPGTFSDDTQMTVALAEGLLAARENDGEPPDLLPLDLDMSHVADEFVRWSKSPKNNRAPGGTCMTGCENLDRGIGWRHSGVPNSKGCGSAMRVAPIGLLFHDDHKTLIEYATASSVMTHGHPTGIDGAVAAALMVALALNGATPREMYEEVARVCTSPDFVACWEKIPSLLDAPIGVALSEQGLGEAWIAEEACASALWCVWKFPNAFRDAVLAGANTDGDSDSIACIAGSISGALLGLDAIPENWRVEIEDAEYLHALGSRLFSAWSLH